MTDPAGLIVTIAGFEPSGVRIYLGASCGAVALQADIAIGVAGLAGLEVSAGLSGVFARPHIGLAFTAP